MEIRQLNRILLQLTIGVSIACNSNVFAAKPDKGKGNNSGPISADVVLRDQDGDAVISDMGIPRETMGFYSEMPFAFSFRAREQ